MRWLKLGHENGEIARRCALYFAIIGIVCAFRDWFLWRHVGFFPSRFFQCIYFFASLLAMGYLASEKQIRMRTSNLIFFALSLCSAAMSWYGELEESHHREIWIWGDSFKVSALIVGALAPPGRWTGPITIGLFTGCALAENYVFSPEVTHRMLAAGNVESIFARLIFAFIIFYFRQRKRELAAAMAHESSEKHAMEEVARAALVVRDLANTPIQTLELSSSMIEEDGGKHSKIRGRIFRALARLRTLNDVLSRYEGNVPKGRYPTSIDVSTLDSIAKGESKVSSS